MSSSKVILKFTVLLVLWSASLAGASEIETDADTAPSTGPAICDGQLINRGMPGVVFDYIRLSAAADQFSFSEFKLIAAQFRDKTDKMASTQKDSTGRAPASSGCVTIVEHLNNLGTSLEKADNLIEAREDLKDLGQLIAEWGLLNQMALDNKTETLAAQVP
jgi:hypothetical protein